MLTTFYGVRFVVYIIVFQSVADHRSLRFSLHLFSNIYGLSSFVNKTGWRQARAPLTVDNANPRVLAR